MIFVLFNDDDVDCVNLEIRSTSLELGKRLICIDFVYWTLHCNSTHYISYTKHIMHMAVLKVHIWFFELAEQLAEVY